jgi:C-terminal processing protease CtpA/Prc
LICAPFSSPVLRFITYPEGPDKRNVAERSHTFEPLGPPSFCGSIALLVGPHSVSAAETLATMLFDARRVTVYGDASSAGSNGNIPGIQLPGSIAFTFSGMEVLHADRSRFVGIGIAPKIPVPVTALDLAKGRDPVLAAAAKGR